MVSGSVDGNIVDKNIVDGASVGRALADRGSVDEVPDLVGALAARVAALGAADLDVLSDDEVMAVVRDLEVVRRRLDASTDRLVGHVEGSGAYGVDGHRSAKSAVKHLGRLPGAEAHRRVQTARALKQLPAVAASYERGEIPTASVRAIARVASNPRVQAFLEVADPVFAEQAAEDPYDEFARWLGQWEALADADGASQAAEQTHRRRDASVAENAIDGSYHLRCSTGGLQGASMAEIFAAFEAAEYEADRAAAVAELGEDARPDQFARTPAQRRADALFAIFRAAASTPADAQHPEPLVSIIVDDETFEAELLRAAGEEVDDDPTTAGDRVCRTTTGRPLHPSDVVAAAVVGMVRRVVVDSASNVIDVGRKRRFYTGTSRDAAFLQASIRDRGGTDCLWSGCDAQHRRLQADHHDPWGREGRTDVANSDILCGFHNRLKEAGFHPVRFADGTWTLVRPDGTPITPAA